MEDSLAEHFQVRQYGGNKMIFAATSLRYLSGGLRASSRRIGVISRPRITASVPISRRLFSTDAEDENARLEKLVTDLRSNPKIATALENFQNLLVSKGFQPDKKPSMMQMMLILTDKEIKASIGDLRAQLEQANIKFSQKDVDAFMKLFGMNMK